MVNKKELNQSFITEIKLIGSVITRMYSHPKLHKPHVPLRPILKMTKSHQQKLS